MTPRSGLERRAYTQVPVPWRRITGIVTLCSVLGGLVVGLTGWLGAVPGSPGKRMTQHEREMDSLKLQDAVLARQDSALGARLNDLRELTLMLVSMKCVEGTPASKEASRKARVPCARVLREQGIDP